MTLCEILTCIICWIELLIKLCKIFIWLMVFLNIFLKYFLLEKLKQFEDHQRDTAEPDSKSCPEFIQELLPSAERTALLYHLSYLCLGNFPKLERLIRKRAIETQLLFGSSEALLVKCAGTSEKLVTSLLPNLKVTLEKNKPQLALKFIEKAKGWISAIIMDVEEIVKRYEKHNSDVAATTSDIITEKQQQTHEMEELQKIIDGLEEKIYDIREEIEDYEKKIEDKNTKMHTFISSITGKPFSIYSMIVPFLESIISHIFKTTRSSPEEDQIKALHADLSEINEAQKRLIEVEWDIQNQLMDNKLKLAKLQTEHGQLSSIRSLDEVQKSLSQIQKNLVRLQKFWEKVGSKLDTLKERTIAGEDWIDDLTDMKEEFLESIDAAEEGWTKFGFSCMMANNIFSIQMNQAYRFLEINPSSLSEEEWQNEYESVKEKLENIKPNTVCLTLLDLAVEKRPNSDSNKPFSINTVIYCRNHAFWLIFLIFEKIAYRNIL